MASGTKLFINAANSFFFHQTRDEIIFTLAKSEPAFFQNPTICFNATADEVSTFPFLSLLFFQLEFKLLSIIQLWDHIWCEIKPIFNKHDRDNVIIKTKKCKVKYYHGHFSTKKKVNNAGMFIHQTFKISNSQYNEQAQQTCDPSFIRTHRL